MSLMPPGDSGGSETVWTPAEPRGGTNLLGGPGHLARWVGMIFVSRRRRCHLKGHLRNQSVADRFMPAVSAVSGAIVGLRKTQHARTKKTKR